MLLNHVAGSSTPTTTLTEPHGHGYVAAVDIGGTNLRLAIADSAGKIIARSTASLTGVRAPEAVVELIVQGVEELLAQASIRRESLRSIAAGAPGVTNTNSGMVIATSYLLGWRDVPLRDLLEEAFGIPAAVDNDVNLAVLGESWAGSAQDSSDFVFVAIGTGLGAGIFLNGSLFRGSGWTAGEIGYLLLPGLPEEPAPRGNPGALEGLLGGEGIKAQWQARWSPEATVLPRDLHATEIFDHAQLGDSLAAAILEQSARMLASVVYNISLILNCPLFVLGGGVGVHPALCEAVQAIVAGWGTRVHPSLVVSSLGEDAQLTGAIRLALDAAVVSAGAIFPSGGRLE